MPRIFSSNKAIYKVYIDRVAPIQKVHFITPGTFKNFTETARVTY